MHGRLIVVQLDVADGLAAARSDEIEAAVNACAAMLACLHLQKVANVDGGARVARCLALADVADGIDFLAQRRALGDA